MSALINNFRIQEPFCAIHTQPCQFALLDNYKMKLICGRCVGLYPSHGSEGLTKIIAIDRLREFITTCVTQQEARLNKSSLIDVHKLIQEKKKEIEQRQYRILEQVMKKLNQDKQNVYAQLDVLQKYYQAQQAKHQFNIDQREQIVKYLRQFCADEELLRLKLMVSNQFGLSSFMAQLRTLEVLGDQFATRNQGLLMSEIQMELRNKEEGTFLNQLHNFYRHQQQQSLVTPLKIGVPKQKCYYNNQATQRKNQSQQNIMVKSPRASRQHSFAQLPRLVMN